MKTFAVKGCSLVVDEKILFTVEKGSRAEYLIPHRSRTYDRIRCNEKQEASMKRYQILLRFSTEEDAKDTTKVYPIELYRPITSRINARVLSSSCDNLTPINKF